MPRGIRNLPVKKTKRAKRKYPFNYKDVQEINSEFLTAGTTHARDKLHSLSKKEQDYNILLDQAEELADFILKNIPFRDGIPEPVIEAYKAIKHRRLKPL